MVGDFSNIATMSHGIAAASGDFSQAEGRAKFRRHRMLGGARLATENIDHLFQLIAGRRSQVDEEIFAPPELTAPTTVAIDPLLPNGITQSLGKIQRMRQKNHRVHPSSSKMPGS